jgi:hypothetical protein
MLQARTSKNKQEQARTSKNKQEQARTSKNKLINEVMYINLLKSRPL